MKYQIKYSYRSGDSLNTYDVEGTLELGWENLEVSKANLKRIQEHYKMFQAINSYFDKRSNQEIIKSFEGNDWLVSDMKLAAFRNDDDWWCIDEKQRVACENKGLRIGEVYDETMAKHCLKLFTDEGKVWQIWAPWCGHFESLYGAEIIADTSDMKFTV